MTYDRDSAFRTPKAEETQSQVAEVPINALTFHLGTGKNQNLIPAPAYLPCFGQTSRLKVTVVRMSWSRLDGSQVCVERTTETFS